MGCIASGEPVSYCRRGVAEDSNRKGKPFEVKDCTLITRMGGVEPALNLRELRERIKICPIESIYHHFCETVIRPSFDDPEFRNDFAVWAAHSMHDRALAERLGIVNPYRFPNLKALRDRTVEIIDDHLSEMSMIPWVRRGGDFQFMRAATVIFSTGIELRGPEDLVRRIPDMSMGSIYYHFVEARRRTRGRTDDFSRWMRDRGGGPRRLPEALESIDFYFLSLPDLKDALLETVRRECGSG